jgi:hypothetical protein
MLIGFKYFTAEKEERRVSQRKLLSFFLCGEFFTVNRGSTPLTTRLRSGLLKLLC